MSDKQRVETLADFIEFQCEEQGLGTDLVAEDIQKQISEAVGGLEEGSRHFSTLQEFSVFMSCTPSVVFKFDGREGIGLTRFRERWMERDRMTPAELWAFRLSISYELIREWGRQWSALQRPFRIDPVQLPASKLNAEHREALDEPNSDFLSSDKPSIGASSKKSRRSGTATDARKTKTTRDSVQPHST